MRTLGQIAIDLYQLQVLDAGARLLGAIMRNKPGWRERIEGARLEAMINATLANQRRRVKQGYGRLK